MGAQFVDRLANYGHDVAQGLLTDAALDAVYFAGVDGGQFVERLADAVLDAATFCSPMCPLME